MLDDAGTTRGGAPATAGAVRFKAEGRPATLLGLPFMANPKAVFYCRFCAVAAVLSHVQFLSF
jgi:hypothetical protein